MPRVHRRVKSTRGRPEFPCRGCNEPIKAGEPFFTWKKRYGGTSYYHVSHGYPKPSMLSNRKTAVIEDAIQDFPSSAESIEDIQAAMQDIASQAREVGSEYESSADNMPESLQQGYQAEAMREVAQELESWADQLEAWEPQDDEPTEEEAIDSAEIEEGSDEQAKEDIVAEELERMRGEWLENELSNAQGELGEMPEYQG